MCIRDSPFYVFDEPTAGLDDAGRGMFAELLSRLRGEDRGVLWITHHPEAVRRVDRVWVMAGGRLILRGDAGARCDPAFLSALDELLLGRRGVDASQMKFEPGGNDRSGDVE